MKGKESEKKESQFEELVPKEESKYPPEYQEYIKEIRKTFLEAADFEAESMEEVLAQITVILLS
jgi:hypothetical protein